MLFTLASSEIFPILTDIALLIQSMGPPQFTLKENYATKESVQSGWRINGG